MYVRKMSIPHFSLHTYKTRKERADKQTDQLMDGRKEKERKEGRQTDRQKNMKELENGKNQTSQPVNKHVFLNKIINKGQRE